MKSFKQKVLDVVMGIPRGKVLTYKEVAILSGSPKAFRAVGTILKGNLNPKLPCHRVIKSDGSFGDYNKGKLNKIKAVTSPDPRCRADEVLARRTRALIFV